MVRLAWIVFVGFVSLLLNDRAAQVVAGDPALISLSSGMMVTRGSVTPHDVRGSLPSRLDHPKLLADRSIAFDAATMEAIREVYVWGWPLVYLNNLKQSLSLVRSPGTSGGAPVAPINSLCMLSDVISPEFKTVPCPNRDVIYGFGMMDLKVEPIVIQVPDFKDRFWLYQLGDHRMESIARLGSMVGTAPGLYLIVGPEWHGEVPSGIQQVFRSSSNLAYILPRVLAEDRKEEQVEADDQGWREDVLSSIVMYPLSRMTSSFRQVNWRKTRRWYPATGHSTRDRVKQVNPDRFFSDLREVLVAYQPTSSDQTQFQVAEILLEKAARDADFASALNAAAERIEDETIVPMFEFGKIGSTLPGHWHSTTKGAAFGSDHWTRTAVAKSNPFVNLESEAKYFYLERAADGQWLDGSQHYEITFPAGALPPQSGFWSLTIYDEDHHLVANPWQRYTLGSLTRKLTHGPDGSLTIRLQADEPEDDVVSNWIPTPAGRFVVYLRVYGPQSEILDGSWLPPAAQPLTPRDSFSHLPRYVKVTEE